MTITANAIRRTLAVLVSVYGVLTASIPALHLPVAVSAILTSFERLDLASCMLTVVIPISLANQFS